MTFSLLPLTPEDLQDLAAARAPAWLAGRVEPGALPPPFVAARALAWLAQGQPARWCSTFLIRRVADGRLVGGCGFKGEPVAGRVEIGYAVAESCRRQGAATAAVGLLLAIAFEAGVDEVLAEVRDDNLASAAVVRGLGFEARGTRTDIDNDTLLQWVAIPPDSAPRSAPHASPPKQESP